MTAARFDMAAERRRLEGSSVAERAGWPQAALYGLILEIALARPSVRTTLRAARELSLRASRGPSPRRVSGSVFPRRVDTNA